MISIRAKSTSLQTVIIPIFEPGLEAIIKRCLREGNLRFTTDAPSAINHGLLQFIAVGTPARADGSADLQHVLRVAGTIGQHIRD